MFNAIIVEDDPLSAGVIAHYCQKSPDLVLQRQFSHPEPALDYLRAVPVDLIFLDVEMPGINGFELLDQLDYSPFVVLITSNTQYAYLAFEYKVVDFLKKPVLFPRFREAVERVSRYDSGNPDSTTADEIFIRSDGKLHKIPYDTIIYIEVVDDYVKIVTENANHLVLSTLKHIEARLNHQFVRTHRSYIVNKKRIENLFDGKIHLGPKVIPVSKTHRPQVLRSINIL